MNLAQSRALPHNLPALPRAECARGVPAQVDACAVNFAFQETSLGIHYNAEGGSSGGSAAGSAVDSSADSASGSG